MKAFCRPLLACLVILWSANALTAEPSVIPLWPEKPPGETNTLPEERDMTKPTDRQVAGKPVLRLSNVSQPTLTIFRPPSNKSNGTTVLVFPGGAYNILATDIEGTEVCDWLNSLGVTAVLVKYRVPRREGLAKHAAPLQDAQRALGLVRHRAAELKINPQRIGVIGFSAGGHLTATLSTSSGARTYPSVDQADAASCRPDFALLIYPAYFTPTNDLTQLVPEVKVTPRHPPTFMAMTQDDALHVENVLVYSLALKQAKVPVELHVYSTGGHGYGLRQTENPSATWPDRATTWLRNQGLISQK